MKLTEEKRQEIFDLFHLLKYTNITRLAEKYGVSRATVQFIVYPERKARMREMERKRRAV